MKKLLQYYIAGLFLFCTSFLILFPLEIYSCNEAVCASVVSKCMLTKSCKCELRNCSCCRECFTCLSTLFDECCSCVDMCPKSNESHLLSSKSHVEDFPEPVPDLFNALTAEPDALSRWKSVTFPVEIDTTPYLPKYDPNKIDNSHNIIGINCTVAYMAQCMSWNKCKASCQTTGASKYRWFHDGCCQCIGNTCVGYGSEKSLCDKCPPSKEEILESDEFFYDEENENIQHLSETSHI